MKNKMVGLILLLFTTIQTKAQVELPKFVHSPEVQAMEKNGNIPVSYYTGVPDISIPIYTVRSGSLELPITLKYQSTAIRVDQEATWVGLNWNLEAGGVISNDMNMYTVCSADMWQNTLSIVKNGAYIGPYTLSDSLLLTLYHGVGGDNLFSLANNPNDVPREIFNDLKNPICGGEARLYQANFASYSFKYIYHPVLQEYKIINNDIKFKFAEESGSPVLTAPDGVKYYFEDGDQSQGYQLTRYLTKIKNNQGNKIELEYRNYGGIQMLPSISENLCYGHPTQSKYERKLITKALINNIYLYEIKTENVIVRFKVSDTERIDIKGDAKKLESIEIIDRSTMQLVKRFRFIYNYFIGCNIGGEYIDELYLHDSQYYGVSKKQREFTNEHIYNRLKLLSLTESAIDKNGIATAKPPYKFYYNENSNTSEGTNLPGKTSAAVDYWGFYNGKENAGGEYYHYFLTDLSNFNNYTSRGLPNSLLNIGKANNNANGMVINWLLNKIEYPTGGFTSLEFESNEFSNPDNLGGTTFAIYTTVRDANYPLSEDLKNNTIFTVDQNREVKFKTYITKNSDNLQWSDLVGSSVTLYQRVYDQSTGVLQNEVVLKNWILSISDALELTSLGYTKKDWIDFTINLPPGDYRLSASLTSTAKNLSLQYGSVDVNCDESYDTQYKYYNGAGVRIKSIANKNSTKYFKYSEENSNLSSGKLITPIEYAQKKIVYYRTENPPCNGGGQYQIVLPIQEIEYWNFGTSNEIPNNKYANGNMVGYSRVEVKNYPDGGREVHTFWNKPSICYATDHLYNYFKYPPLYDPWNGNLIKSRIYDNNNNLLQTKDIDYKDLGIEVYNVNLRFEDLYQGPDRDGCDGNANFITGRARMFIYPAYKCWFNKIKETETNFLTNGTVTQTNTFKYYNENLQVKQIEAKKSNGLIQYTNYTYPTNFYTGLNVNVYDEMVDRNMITQVIEQMTSVGTEESNTTQIEAQKNEFGYFHFVENPVIAPSRLLTKVYPNNYEWRLQFHAYDQKGNVLSVSKEKDISYCYIWGYNWEYPIIKAENTDWNTLNTAFISALSAAQMSGFDEITEPSLYEFQNIKLKAFIKDLQDNETLANANLTIYTYKPLFGMTSQTDPNGLIIYYEYDIFGRLKLVKDKDGKILKQYQYHYQGQ